jgi:hypothetical protein
MFAFVYCIEQTCCHIVIAVDPSTSLPTLSYNVDNIGVLCKSVPTLGPSVNDLGILSNSALTIMGIVVTLCS